MGVFKRNEISLTEAGEGKFTQMIKMGKHTLLADEPEEVGGNDKGPNPYDLLLASLGACTSITVRMYALQKNIPLKGMSITLDHEKVDSENNEKTDLIHCIISLEGDLTSEQEEDLLRIAMKCPVHKTLSHASVIKTTLGTE
ncbi:MAG TPA: OsmC family protein [Alphaproteobacteria bacterium]|nr:OsmC family protein [Alphaproteobacteria bacterium]